MRLTKPLLNKVALVAALSCGAIVLPQVAIQPPLLAQVGVLNNIATELTINSGAFSTLLAAAGAAGLGNTLATGGPFTIFAPTNEAFAALPAGTVPSLLEPRNRGLLTSVLTYHVVPGRISSTALAPGQTVTLRTVQGGTLRVQKNELGEIRVNGVKVILSDIATSNGIIHGIQGVLLP
ncbi:MAG: fasciclin domain-containing protein [Coleofasciculaceae cyanobacterium SM2_1_6]|nr:fasciclin domain-containing protein [Coleofasciculaceae cyanobacterium SM2_1_6]